LALAVFFIQLILESLKMKLLISLPIDEKRIIAKKLKRYFTNWIQKVVVERFYVCNVTAQKSAVLK
jgi:hypothetical protein